MNKTTMIRSRSAYSVLASSVAVLATLGWLWSEVGEGRAREGGGLDGGTARESPDAAPTSAGSGADGRSALVGAPAVEAPRHARSGHDAAAEPEAPGEAEPASSCAEARILVDLDRSLSSFLTEHPRVEELRAQVAELGARAVVEEGSVVEEDGVLRGALRFEGLPGLGAEFRVEPERTVVDLDVALPSGGAEEGHLMCDVSVAFDEDLTDLATYVQYQPDTRRKPRELVEPGERRLLGWSAFTRIESGTELDPVVMQTSEDGAALEIGRLPGRGVEERPWDWDTSSHRPWAALLAGYRR